MKLKKIVCLILAIPLSITASISGYAATTDSTAKKDIPYSSVLTLPKENITFIKGDYTHLGDLEYTYTSGGKHYKVKESSDEALNRVDSEILELNSNGNYVKIAEQTVRKNSSNVVCTTIENGEKSVNTIPLPKVSSPTLSQGNTLSTAIASTQNLPTTNWIFYGVFYSSTRIYAYTITAVSSIILGIVSASTFGVGTAIAISTTTRLVAQIVTDQIPNIYYKDYVYYKTVIPPEPGQYAMKVAEENTRCFFSDSARTQQLEGSPVTTDTYLRGYEE